MEIKHGEETKFPLTVTYDSENKAIVFEDGNFIDYYDIENGLGDVDNNGIVNGDDINTMISFLQGTSEITSEQKAKIDTNGDGIFSGSDLIRIYELTYKKYGSSNFINAKGDVNLDGKINDEDAQMIQRYIAGYSLEEQQKIRADINGISGIDTMDAVYLRMLIADTIEKKL